MVAQLGIDLHRAPHENQPGSIVPDASTNRFHTPPPPPPNLSPIAEKTTEQQETTPQNRPQQPQLPQAVHFGQLTPEQLPHPQFPPNTRAPSTSTNPNPPTTAPIVHWHQTTNPTTHPHMYSTPSLPTQHYHPPAPSFSSSPTSHPNITHLHHHLITPTLTTIHHPPHTKPFHHTPITLIPHHHKSTLSIPIPLHNLIFHTTLHLNQYLPILSSNKRDTTDKHHTQAVCQEPYIRTPSVDLPLFFGDNALAWIEECESIFQLTGITNDSKVKWANAHMRGKAKTWLSSSSINLYLLNWPQFCDLICDRFPAPGEHESMEQF
jgi:hypothetical protein